MRGGSAVVPHVTLFLGIDVLLDGPFHGEVADDERRYDVEDLATGAAECVEEGVFQRTGERLLSVGRKGVGGDALLGWGA